MLMYLVKTKTELDRKPLGEQSADGADIQGACGQDVAVVRGRPPETMMG